MKEEAIGIPGEEPRREALFRKAKQEAANSCITITGDTKTGSFAGATVIGEIEGTYRTDDKNVYVVVTKKPTCIPDFMLKNLLINLFSEDD